MRTYPKQDKEETFSGEHSWKRYVAILFVAVVCYLFFFKVVFF